MTDLRELNRKLQNATFPSHEFASAVREMLAEVAERLELEGESVIVKCPSCGWWQEGDCPDCQPAQSEPAVKAECPNCRKCVARSTDHCSMDQALGGSTGLRLPARRAE